MQLSPVYFIAAKIFLLIGVVAFCVALWIWEISEWIKVIIPGKKRSSDTR